MELIDCHSHTALSGHGSGTVRDAVARAQELGLSAYCMTEHLTLPASLDPNNEDGIPADSLQGYLDDLRAERQRLTDEGSGMELVIGIEADWLGPGREVALAEAVKPFEYVLGSVHFLDNLPIDNSDNMKAWDRMGDNGLWQRYFRAWIEMVESSVPFTAFAHPDLPKVFGRRPSFRMDVRYTQMAAAVAEKGAMVEVNTAGWRKPADEQYPCVDLLKEFCRAGVDCTVGCDAHKPEDIGRDVERAYDVLRQAGYDRVAVPLADGGRRYIAL